MREQAAPVRRDFEVSLPPHLHRFGTSVRAMLVGEGPAVVVLGGISGTRFVCKGADGEPGWWPGLVEEGGGICPRRFAVLGVDYAADEQGDVAPTTREQAEAVRAVMDAAGIARAAVVGASYGGMVALSLAALDPARVERLVVVCADAAPHPFATALRELQRRTVALGIAHGCGGEALAIARGMAMLSYRTAGEFEGRFSGGLEGEAPLGVSAPGAYLRACGEAFGARMSPGRFLSLSASIDRHRVDPARVTAPALLLASQSDQLVPPGRMQGLADRLGGPSALHVLPSIYGHDVFLKDAARVGELVGPFLRQSA